MSKTEKIKITGDVTGLNRLCGEYLGQKLEEERAEALKKETAEKIKTELRNVTGETAGGYTTGKYEFSVVSDVVTETISFKKLKEEAPELYITLKDGGFIKSTIKPPYVTGVKQL